MLITLVIALAVVIMAGLFVKFIVWLGDKSYILLMTFFVLALWALFEWLRRIN